MTKNYLENLYYSTKFLIKFSYPTSKNEKFVKTFYFILIVVLFLDGCSSSPITENLKKHERILKKSFAGDTLFVNDFFEKPIEIYIPKNFNSQKNFNLLIHFHGASYVPKAAVESVNENIVLAVVNLGIGSSVYEKPFLDAITFPQMIGRIYFELLNNYSELKKTEKIILTSFSAGYGAVRRILQHHTNLIDGVILMDGMHTDYIPDGVELSQGGQLNTEKLDLYLPLAKLAMEKKKSFIISHSDIYPEKYASNRETADYLIEKLKLHRAEKDDYNLIGMHQTSETNSGNFVILGFDGNTAKDHVDHFHALSVFLCKLLNCSNFQVPELLIQ